MEIAKCKEEDQIIKEAEELENLRKMREKMQKEHENHIKLQNEIEVQINEEKIRKQELKEISERQILNSYLKTCEIGGDFSM